MTATISDPDLMACPGTRTGGRRTAGRTAARGREVEHQVTRDLLRRARRGVGGVVLVEGEPGIGKSLLLRNGVDEAAEQGFSLAMAAADQLGKAAPLRALHAAVRSPVARFDGDPDPGRPEAAERSVAWVREHLRERAATVPVLVCLDDLHWADPATLAALRELPRDLSRHPIAWLLARSSASPNAAGYLFGQLEKDGARRISLVPLAEEEVSAMLADALGAPPSRALADLARSASGNPSLVAELISGLSDAQQEQTDGESTALGPARLPPRIHRLARQRLDGLTGQARHLLMTAAVLGPTFHLEDAAQMLGATPAALLPAVEESIEAAIIAAAEDTFTFRHELLRRALEETIPLPARRALHRQYGEILLAQGNCADQAAVHLLQSVRSGDAGSLSGLDKAAARTLLAAPQIAAGLAVRALELTPAADPAALSRSAAATEALIAAGRLDQAAAIADGLLSRPLPQAVEDRLRCALSMILCARGRPQDAAVQAQLVLDRPQLTRALRDQALTARLRALAGARDPRAGQLADAVLASPARNGAQAPVAALIARAILAWDGGRASAGLELLRDAARCSTGSRADARTAQPLLALAAALVDLRQLDEAESILGAADDPATRDTPAGAALSLLRARAHLAAGRLADAAAAAELALAVACAGGAYGHATAAHCVLSLIELRCGRVAAAAQHLGCLPASGPQFAEIYARPETAAARVQLIEAQQGPTAALGLLRQLSASLQARPGPLLGDPALAASLARAALAAGDSGLAVTIARAAEAAAVASPGLPCLAAAAAHSQGLVRHDPGRLAEAAERHPDPWARASAAEDLGVLHAGQGDRGQAIGHLDEAIGAYRRIGADRDEARVRRRLRRLGIRRRHWSPPRDQPVTGWQSLTDTQQAVAGLVAQGLSNGQIAARMYISPHTVAYHLRQTFLKLSVASRWELTRVVIERAADG